MSDKKQDLIEIKVGARNLPTVPHGTLEANKTYKVLRSLAVYLVEKMPAGAAEYTKPGKTAKKSNNVSGLTNMERSADNQAGKK